MGPEFFVTVDHEQPKQVQFEEIRDFQRDRISSVILLWDVNSYIINIAEHCFIINGGKRIVPDFIKEIEHPILEYAMRNTASISQKELDEVMEHKPMNLSDRAFRTYLFGIMDQNQPTSHHQMFIEVSEDGKWWTWRGRRK